MIGSVCSHHLIFTPSTILPNALRTIKAQPPPLSPALPYFASAVLVSHIPMYQANHRSIKATA